LRDLDRPRTRPAAFGRLAGASGGELFAGVGWSAVAQAAPLVVNVALTPYLIRHLGLDRFGVWSLVLVLSCAVYVAGVVLFIGRGGSLGDRPSRSRNPVLLLATLVNAVLTVPLALLFGVVAVVADIASGYRDYLRWLPRRLPRPQGEPWTSSAV
jgi:hypothetical protein